jgi:AAA15 family ATPase/GTPase
MSERIKQKIRSIHINSLKGIVDLTVSFENHPLTAIMGPNCSGKTTILYALACSFKPPNRDDPNSRFSDFFIPNSDTKWLGSSFSIIHDYVENNQHYIEQRQEYKKDIDRWKPIYNRRPERYTCFIGISASIPEIELQTKKSLVQYTREPRILKQDKRILQNAAAILNKNYNSFENITYNHNHKIIYGIGTENIKYTALTMSSGEQRLLYILEKVYQAPPFSLILIDEIDIFLHQSALFNLIKVLDEISHVKGHQIVFTTHFPQILDLDKIINIITLANFNGKSISLMGNSSIFYYSLTGLEDRKYRFYVEDDLSKAIIHKIAGVHKIRQQIRVDCFGSVDNAFTLAAGLCLQKDIDIKKSVIIIDGDVSSDDTSKKDRIKKVLTGNNEADSIRRDKAFSLIISYKLDANSSPEKIIFESIKKHKYDESLDVELKELLDAINEIESCLDPHDYLLKPIERVGFSKEIGLDKCIDLFKLTENWDKFIQPIDQWIKKTITAS